jgi:hypothetical protein
MRQSSEALDQYIPAREAARALGRSASTLKDRRAWQRLGLTPRRIGKRWMFSVVDIRRLQSGLAATAGMNDR